MIMWSAVSLRILDHGSTRSPSQGSTTGPGTTRTPGPTVRSGVAGRSGGRAVRGSGGPNAGGASRDDRKSVLVRPPARPEPGIVAMWRLCSAAILRTRGVDFLRRRSSSDSSDGATDGRSGGRADGRSADAIAAAGAGAGAVFGA